MPCRMTIVHNGSRTWRNGFWVNPIRFDRPAFASSGFEKLQRHGLRFENGDVRALVDPALQAGPIPQLEMHVVRKCQHTGPVGWEDVPRIYVLVRRIRIGLEVRRLGSPERLELGCT